jgi:hypothetical protein
MTLSLKPSFEDLIVISAVILLVIFLLIRRYLSVKGTARKIESSQELRNQRVGDILNLGCLVLTLAILALSFLPRGTVWFALRLVVLSLVAMYAFYKPQSKLTILYLVINIAAASIAPMISLGFTAGEADQIGHISAAQTILANGHITRLQLGGLEDPYYVIFPVLDFLIAGLSSLTGLNPFLSLGILQVLIPIIAALSVIYISRFLTGDYLASVVAVLIFLATDRLALWYLIPENLAVFFGLIALIPLIGFVMNPSKVALVFLILFATFTNLVHASFGGLLVMALPLIAFAYWRKRIGYSAFVITSAITVVIALLSYWTIWNITTSVGSRVQFVLATFLHAFTGAAVTTLSTKQSLLALYSSYAFLSWALPAAIAGFYLVDKFLSRKLDLLSNRSAVRDKRDIFLMPATIIAFIILVVGFYSTYGEGSLALERYTDIPAYAVFMITATVVATTMMRDYKKPVTILIMALLIVSLVLGGSQLNWAPDQYQSSSYGYTNQQAFYSSNTILNFLPNTIPLYHAPTLQFINYWNMNTSTVLPEKTLVPLGGVANAIDGNRSATASFLVSTFAKSRTQDYFLLGSDQIVNYNRTFDSPYIDIVFSNGQDFVATGYH